eukprot:4406714-Prymnesium_polylepis.1
MKPPQPQTALDRDRCGNSPNSPNSPFRTYRPRITLHGVARSENARRGRSHTRRGRQPKARSEPRRRSRR